jgi:hypothetical protein
LKTAFHLFVRIPSDIAHGNLAVFAELGNLFHHLLSPLLSSQMNTDKQI